MKKIICSLFLMAVITSPAFCWDYQYEVTKSTFNFGTVAISSTAPTLVSLAPAQLVKNVFGSYTIYSTSLYNVSATSATYALHTSTFTAPALTCANGPIIGSGTTLAPFVLTEQFEGLYMWALSCDTANATNTMRRVFRGR